MTTHRRSVRPANRLRLLSLERRITPTISTVWDVVQGHLSIVGTDNDGVELVTPGDGTLLLNGSAVTSGGAVVPDSSIRSLSIQFLGDGNNACRVNKVDALTIKQSSFTGGQERYYPKVEIPRITVDLGGGNDTFDGSNFAEAISGGPGADVIRCGGGDDFLIDSFFDVFTDPSFEGGPGRDTTWLRSSGGSLNFTKIKWESNATTGTNTVTTDTGIIWSPRSNEQIVMELPASSISALTVTGLGFSSPIGTTGSEFRAGQSPQGDWRVDSFFDIFTELALVGGGGSGGGAGGSAFAAPDLSKHRADSFFDIFTESSLNGSQKWLSSDVKPFDRDHVSIDLLYTGTISGFVGGGVGDDTFTVSPGNSPLTVNGGQGTDQLAVDNLGQAAVELPGRITVPGRAPVLHQNFETASQVHIIRGQEALDSLKAGGVLFDVASMPGPGGSTEHKTTLINTSPTPVTYYKVTFEDLLVSSYSSSMNVDITPNPQGATPLEILADGKDDDCDGKAEDFDITAGALRSLTLTHAPTGNWAVDSFFDITYRVDFGGKRHEFSADSFFDVFTEFSVDAKSTSPSGATSMTAESTLLGVDASGRVPVSLSAATDLDPNVSSVSPGLHVFAAGRMVDVTPDGTSSGNGTSSKAAVSADGRFVAFVSTSNNLDPTVEDLNGVADLYFRDLTQRKTYVIPHILEKSGRFTPNGPSSAPRVSVDGRFVTFLSTATNLIPGLPDTNNAADLFRWDSTTDAIECLSLNFDKTATANKGVLAHALSADGTVVCWASDATDMKIGDGPGLNIVEWKGGVAEVSELTTWSSANSCNLVVAGDGLSFCFWTDADVGTFTGVPDGNGVSDIVRKQIGVSKWANIVLKQGATQTGNGASPATGSGGVSVSYDGRHVAFISDATDLDSSGSTVKGGTFLVDSFFDITYRLDFSGGAAGGFGGGGANPNISFDGSMVAWNSKADLVNGGSLPFQQVWVHSTRDKTTGLATGQRQKMSLAGNGDSTRPLLCADGACVVFQSAASDLGASDTNGFVDIFLSRQAVTLEYELPSGNGADAVTIKSKSGHVVVFDDTSGKELASRPIGMTRRIRVIGPDMEPDQVTIEFGAGLGRTDAIQVDLGAGAGDSLDVNDYGLSRISHLQASQNSQSLRTGGDVSIRADDCDDTKVTRAPVRGFNLMDAFPVSFSLSDNGDPTDGLSRIKFGGEQVAFGPMAANYAKGKHFESVVIRLTEGDDTFSFTGLDPVFNQPDRSVRVDLGGGNDLATSSSVSDRKALLQWYMARGHDSVTTDNGPNIVFDGPGNDLIATGAGDDQFFLTPGSADKITDTGGVDTVDFSAAAFGVTLDLDSPAPQVVFNSHTVELIGQIENVVGSNYDDILTVDPAAFARSVDGGPHTFGDQLSADLQGKLAYLTSGQLQVAGLAAMSVSQIETLTTTNSLPAPQVSLFQVNDGAVQRSRVTSLTVAFNGAVTFTGPPGAAFVLQRSDGLAFPVDVALTTELGFSTAVLSFSGSGIESLSLPDGKYTLTVLSAGVVGGLATGDYATQFHRLFGDADGDQDVDTTDFGAFRGVYGGSSFAFDFDNDGDVDTTDFGAFRGRFGASL